MQGYDAVIRIHNIFHFVHAILSADAKGEQRLKRFAALDPVQYADFPLDFSRQRFPRLTFIKERSQFEWQSEVRVLFGDRIPKDSTSQYYSLQIPNLDKLIDIVEVPAHWSGSLHQ